MTCKECGCTTGGAEHCYAHAPYTVQPLRDGSFRSYRHGLKRIWMEAPPFVQGELAAAYDAGRKDGLETLASALRKALSPATVAAIMHELRQLRRHLGDQ